MRRSLPLVRVPRQGWAKDGFLLFLCEPIPVQEALVLGLQGLRIEKGIAKQASRLLGSRNHNVLGRRRKTVEGSEQAMHVKGKVWLVCGA